MLYAGHGRQQGVRRKAEPDLIDGLVPSAGHTRCVRMSKTEAFDGKEGREADRAAELVPRGPHARTALKSIRRPKPDLRGLERGQCLLDQPHPSVDLLGA